MLSVMVAPVPNLGESGLAEVSFYGGEIAIRKFSMTVAVRPQPMSDRYQFGG